MPSPLVLLDWGSASTTRTWTPRSASAAPRFRAVVVLPTPPFWFAMAIVFDVDINMLGSTWGKLAISGVGNDWSRSPASVWSKEGSVPLSPALPRHPTKSRWWGADFVG